MKGVYYRAGSKQWYVKFVNKVYGYYDSESQAIQAARELQSRGITK